ncbi:MAG: zinc ribbon domain-containing protein [Candidatus Aminicenantes bacterium]|nr:zinc ribbon domain-containing protein [Candidatus Aminicenantes bacterium]
MPLHEYKCSECGVVFEVLQKISDSPLKKCIKCGGPVNKLVSSPAIQFKGSGWYVTDYALKKDRAAAAEKKVSPKIQEPPASKPTEQKNTTKD